MGNNIPSIFTTYSYTLFVFSMKMSGDKKPSYLYEVFDSASEEESQVENLEEKSRFSVFICKEIEHQPKCYLCAKVLKLCFDLSEHVDGEHTYSAVLGKIFSKESLPPRLARRDSSQGLLCTECRDMVKDLYRLQRELRSVKQAIISTFRDSDEGATSSDESDAEVVSVRKQINPTRKSFTDEDEDSNKRAKSPTNLKR